MKFYYYTRWTFKTDSIPDGLGHVGPYHSTWVTESNPKEFIANITIDVLQEFIIKQFDSRQAMRTYWDSLHN